jgi:hypothetical protein
VRGTIRAFLNADHFNVSHLAVNRLFLSLLVTGAVSMLSAIYGILSLSVGSQGSDVTHATGLDRVVLAAYSCAVFACAWGIRSRKRLAWRAFFVACGLQWIFFVYGSTRAVASGYQNPPTSDIWLFAGLVAVLSLPVAVYWARRYAREYAASFPESRHG